jgi:hypothetical protein
MPFFQERGSSADCPTGEGRMDEHERRSFRGRRQVARHGNGVKEKSTSPTPFFRERSSQRIARHGIG